MQRRTFLAATPATIMMASQALGVTKQGPPTVGIMGGEIDGTFMRIATDLTSVLNSDALRVVPIVGKGSLQNLGDLLNLPGVDLALIAADVLAYAKQQNLYPGDLQKVAYICKLYDNDVHVCARPEITSLDQLEGKPVNIDVRGAGTNLSARAIFKAFGIQPDLREEEPTIAQSRLQKGEIAANVYLGGKPVRLFATQPAGTGLHLLNVPMNAVLAETYLPGGRLTSAEYPALIQPDQTIETIGVGVTLACFNWPAGSERYRRLVTFVDGFFGKFAELLKPPHHPAWHHVNLAASQPGWTRFKPAADWLAQQQQVIASNSPERAKFDAFLAQHGGDRLTAEERDATWAYLQQQLTARGR